MIFSKLIDIKVLIVTTTVQVTWTCVMTCMIAKVVGYFSVGAINATTIAVTLIHSYKNKYFCFSYACCIILGGGLVDPSQTYINLRN